MTETKKLTEKTTKLTIETLASENLPGDSTLQFSTTVLT
jgi:hypothetical protein